MTLQIPSELGEEFLSRQLSDNPYDPEDTKWLVWIKWSLKGLNRDELPSGELGEIAQSAYQWGLRFIDDRDVCATDDPLLCQVDSPIIYRGSRHES